jgi:hypothetical protein
MVFVEEKRINGERRVIVHNTRCLIITKKQLEERERQALMTKKVFAEVFRLL